MKPRARSAARLSGERHGRDTVAVAGTVTDTGTVTVTDTVTDGVTDTVTDTVASTVAGRGGLGDLRRLGRSGPRHRG